MMSSDISAAILYLMSTAYIFSPVRHTPMGTGRPSTQTSADIKLEQREQLDQHRNMKQGATNMYICGERHRWRRRKRQAT